MNYRHSKNLIKTGLIAWKNYLLQHKFSYLTGLFLIFVIVTNVSFGFNATTSINKKFFIIFKNIEPSKGNYVAFKWHGKAYDHLENKILIKHLVGISGDTLRIENREVFLNNQSMGVAFEKSSDGTILLNVNSIQEVPKDHFYVKGDSLDSLDSRYEVVGFINKKYVIGTAYALF